MDGYETSTLENPTYDSNDVNDNFDYEDDIVDDTTERPVDPYRIEKLRSKTKLKLAKVDLKKQKAKSKPILKAIGVAGLVIWLIKFMTDHHDDKMAKDKDSLLKQLNKDGKTATKETIDKVFKIINPTKNGALARAKAYIGNLKDPLTKYLNKISEI